MPPAARVTDMHTCPMVTGVVPHVGGPILPAGHPTTIIGGLPAARIGDLLTCVGPPDTIVKGSPTVLIGGMPAARMGDNTAHGGVIVLGHPTTIIGDAGSGGGGGGGGGGTGGPGSSTGGDAESGTGATAAGAGEGGPGSPTQIAATTVRSQNTAAAESGRPLCELCQQEDSEGLGVPGSATQSSTPGSAPPATSPTTPTGTGTETPAATGEETPTEDTTKKKENLSGKSRVTWANSNAKKSNKVSDLAEGFRKNVQAFIKALEDAGATVSISTTKRSKKRAYLFHWSWKIGLSKCKASDATAMEGVDIEWDHGKDDESVAGAKEMIDGFGLAVPPKSKYAPSLSSKHISAKAIDMTITWSGTMKVKKKDGAEASVKYMEKVNENTKLHEVGDSYGVKKLKDDAPHWSDDGH